MPNPIIPRDQVHALAEACSDAGENYQATAARLVKEQRRLSRFFEQNAEPMGPMASQVSLYMLSVCMRIFEQVGGRMKKVTGRDVQQAVAKVEAQVDKLFPPDAGFASRAKEQTERAQPHILDEVLWALYEREDEEIKDEEQEVDPQNSALIYTMLWTAVEALDANWTAPADYVGEQAAE